MRKIKSLKYHCPTQLTESTPIASCGRNRLHSAGLCSCCNYVTCEWTPVYIYIYIYIYIWRKQSSFIIRTAHAKPNFPALTVDSLHAGGHCFYWLACHQPTRTQGRPFVVFVVRVYYIVVKACMWGNCSTSKSPMFCLVKPVLHSTASLISTGTSSGRFTCANFAYYRSI